MKISSTAIITTVTTIEGLVPRAGTYDPERLRDGRAADFLVAAARAARKGAHKKARDYAGTAMTLIAMAEVLP